MAPHHPETPVQCVGDDPACMVGTRMPIEETMRRHHVVCAGQGAVRRWQQPVLLAVRQGAARRGTERLDDVRADAESLQPPYCEEEREMIPLSIDQRSA